MGLNLQEEEESSSKSNGEYSIDKTRRRTLLFPLILLPTLSGTLTLLLPLEIFAGLFVSHHLSEKCRKKSLRDDKKGMYCGEKGFGTYHY